MSDRYEKVVQDKENLAADFEHFKREVKHTAKGNAAKEIRILKKVVQNLEVGHAVSKQSNIVG